MAPAPSPATLVPDLSFAGSVGTAVGHRSKDRYKPRFSYQARSPLPHLIVVLVLIGIAVYAIANIDSTAYDQSTDLIETSTGGAVTSAVGEDDDTMVMVAVAAALAGFVAMCVLIGRIGRNARGMVSSFSGWTAAVALPAWHTIVLNQAVTRDVDAYSSRLFTLVACLVLVLVGYCILQGRLFSRLWEAGGFGGERWAALLWIPPAVAWSVLYTSAIFTIVSIGEDGTGSSSWEPTERMALFADGAVLATGLGLIVLLIAVAVAQHSGIAADRAAMHAERTTADQPVI